jgi:pimeloyl-ACP methyl ester carboxylesterase
LIGLNSATQRGWLAGDRAGPRSVLADARESILADPLAGMRAIMDTAPAADQEIMNDPDWQAMFVTAFSEALRPGVDGWVDESEALALRWDEIDLDAVACSITWWHGTHDRNAPLSAAERLIARLSNARLVVWDEAGHLIAYHKETEILDELAARC